MLPLKVLFLFIALAKANRCQDIQTIFYQTEDQYDAKGCDSNLKTNPFQVSEFDKQCQLLQKKMDIFGQRFYDFGAWSDWSECQNGKHQRRRQSCTGRSESENTTCQNVNTQKVLIATGWTVYNEVIDVSQKTGTCSKTSFFPSELVGAAGALVNDVPFICGGRHTSVSSAINSCSILKHGRFVSIDPKMPEKRFNSAAIEFKGKLWVTGGRTPLPQHGSKYSRYLKSTLLIDQNTIENFIDLPDVRGGHCFFKIKENLAFLAGGWTKITYFLNLKTLQWTKGPNLPTNRFEAGCSSFEHNGSTILVIAGGHSTKPRSKSVIFLRLNEKKWRIGPDLPLGLAASPMLPTPDNHGVMAFGGWDGRHNRVDILKLTCPSSLQSCKWTKLDQKMRFGRALHLAMYLPHPIPQSLGVC